MFHTILFNDVFGRHNVELIAITLASTQWRNTTQGKAALVGQKSFTEASLLIVLPPPFVKLFCRPPPL